MSHKYVDLATDFDLWQEYVDPAGTISRETFEAMTVLERQTLIVVAFGPEPWPVAS